MKRSRRLRAIAPAGLSAAAMLLAPYAAAQDQTAQASEAVAARLQMLKQQVDEQTRKLDALKRSVSEQEASLNDMRRTVANEMLAVQRGGQAAAGSAGAPAAGTAQPAADTSAQGQAPATVGQAQDSSAALNVARSLELPGVLTPRGKFVVEPSFNYSNSASLRVSLVGYTIIPAIHIGVIDVRDVRRNTYTASLRASYGVTNRFEIEGRIPYLYRSDDAIGREFGTGTATDLAFNSTGSGIGDVEVTARYQLNDGGADMPYFVGSMRFKTRTGRDPYDGTFDTTLPGFRGELVQDKLPTGSGFFGLQGGLTVLYPADPVVLFGGVSYLHSFPRDNVTIRLQDGTVTDIGRVAPGGIIGFNMGIGLGLNEKMSLSLGYDHNSVGAAKTNGEKAPDAVRFQLGTMLVGLSYRRTPTSNINFTLGVGVTRDSPDVTLSLRYPMTF